MSPVSAKIDGCNDESHHTYRIPAPRTRPSLHRLCPLKEQGASREWKGAGTRTSAQFLVSQYSAEVSRLRKIKSDSPLGQDAPAETVESLHQTCYHKALQELRNGSYAVHVRPGVTAISVSQRGIFVLLGMAIGRSRAAAARQELHTQRGKHADARN